MTCRSAAASSIMSGAGAPTTPKRLVLAEALEAVRLGRDFPVRIHRLEISAFGPFAGTERSTLTGSAPTDFSC